MKKHHIVILIIALMLTALVFVNDYFHDPTAEPYPVREIIKDIVFAGSFYTALFYAMIFGFYSWYKDSRLEQFIKKYKILLGSFAILFTIIGVAIENNIGIAIFVFGAIVAMIIASTERRPGSRDSDD